MRPTWIREFGIVVLWSAAAVNVTVYVFKAGLRMYQAPPLKDWQGGKSQQPQGILPGGTPSRPGPQGPGGLNPPKPKKKGKKGSGLLGIIPNLPVPQGPVTGIPFSPIDDPSAGLQQF